jgi:hypothetical protein
VCYQEYELYISLKRIDLQNDSVIAAAEKVNSFKEKVNTQRKVVLIALPIVFSGFLMHGWKAYYFGSHYILLLAGLMLFAFVFGKRQIKIINNRIDNLKRDILDLKEYKE